jgi:hypothetical protein
MWHQRCLLVVGLVANAFRNIGLPLTTSLGVDGLAELLEKTLSRTITATIVFMKEQ